eukprot:TRINITY_DN4905_c0_g1_i13.p1 TRINITY_DN4905_c0_g1~~TRINITY_DN4905_c0_g1_i13.p1  ORF type:complete len:235 (-),score=29.68 TRINITY_DN4905_c0_g1_i13:661-1365(-)
MKATILQVAIFCLQALQLTGFSAIDVRAVGANRGSFGAARAQGFGSRSAVGSASVVATNNFVSSQATAVATGGGNFYKPAPKGYYKPPKYDYKPAKYDYKPPKKDYYYTPKSTKYHPTYYPYHPAPVVVVKKPSKSVKVVKKCDSMKSCYDFDSYSKCGYCLIDKYPIYGYGCDYDVYYGKKTGDISLTLLQLMKKQQQQRLAINFILLYFLTCMIYIIEINIFLNAIIFEIFL